jgi:hypothetical protein
VQRHGIGQQVQRSSSGSTPHDRVTILQICSSRSLALDRLRQSALRYPAVRSNRADTYSVRRQPAPIHTPLRSRTTSAIAPPTISHSARGTQIPITHAAPPTYPFPRFPCMGLFLSRSSPERQIFCPSSVSLFDLKARFFVPTRGSLTSSRAGAVKVGRRANLAACSELARPYLDSFEHDGTLGAIGMTIRGKPAFGRGSVAPQPCIRWIQGPEP